MTAVSTVLLEVQSSAVAPGIAVAVVATTVTVRRIARMLIQIAGGMFTRVVVVTMAVAVLHFAETIPPIAIGVEQVATVVVTTVPVQRIARLLARANVVATLTIVRILVAATTVIADGSVGTIRRIVVGTRKTAILRDADTTAVYAMTIVQRVILIVDMAVPIVIRMAAEAITVIVAPTATTVWGLLVRGLLIGVLNGVAVGTIVDADCSVGGLVLHVGLKVRFVLRRAAPATAVIATTTAVYTILTAPQFPVTAPLWVVEEVPVPVATTALVLVA